MADADSVSAVTVGEPAGRPACRSPDAHPDPVDTLVAQLARVSTRFTGDVIRDRDRARTEVVHAAASVVPGVECAGFVVVEPGGQVTSGHASGPRAEHLDRAQVVLREGPALTALDETCTDAGRAGVWVADMGDPTDGGRWPRFAAEAGRRGVAAMMSVRLPGNHEGRSLALTLYVERPEALDATARRTATLYASHAAIALRAADQVAALGRALASRDAIGQAKGILMERRRVSSDEAFRLLVEASQRSNLKLRDAAQWLIDQGAESRSGNR